MRLALSLLKKARFVSWLLDTDVPCLETSWRGGKSRAPYACSTAVVNNLT